MARFQLYLFLVLFTHSCNGQDTESISRHDATNMTIRGEDQSGRRYKGREIVPCYIEIRSDTIYLQDQYVSTSDFGSKLKKKLKELYLLGSANDSLVLGIKIQFDNEQSTDKIVNTVEIVRNTYEWTWNELALMRYEKNYADLEKEQKQSITKFAPYLVSSATPTTFD